MYVLMRPSAVLCALLHQELRIKEPLLVHQFKASFLSVHVLVISSMKDQLKKCPHGCGLTQKKLSC